MRELPIGFSTEMTIANLERRKSQTRRVIVPQPSRTINDWSDDAEPGEVVMYRGWPNKITTSRGRNKRDAGELTPVKIKARYQVGDRLWHKEAIYGNVAYGDTHTWYAYYKCDDTLVAKRGKRFRWRWKSNSLPALFMPKEAARTWSEVTKVRAGRVQDISIGDAEQEGIRLSDEQRLNLPLVALKNYVDICTAKYGSEPPEKSLTALTEGIVLLDLFIAKWNQINPKHDRLWQGNPWVFVYDYTILSTTGRPERSGNEKKP